MAAAPGATVPFMRQLVVLLAALTSTANGGDGCNCEATCAELIAGLQQRVAQLQAQVHSLRGSSKQVNKERGNEIDTRAVLPRAALPDAAYPCGTDWHLHSDAVVAANRGCRSGRELEAVPRHTALPAADYPCGTTWHLDVDAHVAWYRGCRSVGKLVVGPEVTSLVGLEALETAEDIFIEGNLYLRSLRGLDGLRSVGNDLQLWKLESLVSLDGLESLSRVGRQLGLWRNWGLTSLSGLESLQTAGGVWIDSVDVTSLTGLERLTRVDGELQLDVLTELTSLSGLESLSHVGTLSLIYLNALTSLSGLKSLQTVDGIHIWQANTLESLDGLQNLRGALDVLDLKENRQLESLAHLEKLTTVRTLRIYDNFRLKSLVGLEQITSVTGRLTIERSYLKSLSGLRGLQTVRDFSILGQNAQVDFDLGLESLERVEGELKITEHLYLKSLDSLKNLKHVGALTLEKLSNLETLAGLQNLAVAQGWVFISEVPLKSLEGLALHRVGRLRVQAPFGNRRMEYLGGVFAAGASADLLFIDEAAWPSCTTAHERIALVSVVGDLNASSIPNASSVPSDESGTCTVRNGTLACTKGHPCSFSLAGEESIFISDRYTGCGLRSEKHVQGNVTRDGMVHLGYALKDQEAGLRSVCRSGGESGPVAQLFLRGPRHGGVTVCSLGQNCSFEVDGDALEPTDHMVLMVHCNEGDVGSGFPASSTAENVYLVHDPTKWYAAPPNHYQVCWRAPCSSVADGPVCPPPEDTYFHVGGVDLVGPYRRNFELVLGDHLAVPNVGLGVSDFDRIRLRRTCGKANEEGIDLLEAISVDWWFDFGKLTEARVQAGIHQMCWCQERESVKCNAERHFMAEAGIVNILCPPKKELASGRCVKCRAGTQKLDSGLELCAECPAGQYSWDGWACETCWEGAFAKLAGSSVCANCQAWESSNADATGCFLDPAKMLLLGSFYFFGGAFCVILVCNVRRRPRVVDVSLDQGRTVITTFKSHGFSNLGRKSFPARLVHTGHPGLRSPMRVRVRDAVRLELLTSHNKPIGSRLDTSKGSLVVPFPHDLYHRIWPVPPLLCLPALFFAEMVLGVSALFANMMTQALMGLGVVAAICTAASAVLRLWQPATPLAQRLSEFQAQLTMQLPNPQRCDKGPGRALSVGKLHELLDFFRDFIRDRTAYYMDTNILQPLTKAKKLSYAELVGAAEVEWFVSHFWGTAFEHFCTALQKHAEMACGNRKWTELNYWVCFCSNNQHQIRDEIGTGWEESSFYLTLKSGHCQGTCMVLDDKALPLTRIWCIFELVQTVKLQHHQEGFQGLLLCTSSGVLNTGGGSLEVAMALSKRVAEMDLEMAEASSAVDAENIRRQVMEEMGSFRALNHFVSHEVREMLVQAQRHSSEQFAAVFALLDHGLAESMAWRASV